MVYQLDYNPEGRAHRAEYLQMFRDCGWEYLQDYLGYAYFRKPAAAMRGEEEEIFSDDASRLQMLRHVFRWRVIPLGLLLLLALVPLYVGALCDGPTASPRGWGFCCCSASTWSPRLPPPTSAASGARRSKRIGKRPALPWCRAGLFLRR